MVADEGVSASSVGASAYGAAIHLSEGTPKMHRHLGILPATALILVLGSTAAFAGPAGADPDLPDPTVPSAADPGAKASAAGADNRSEQAEAALATVQAMFGDGGARAPRSGADVPDATLALRDLAQLKGSLSDADRERAESYLARPTDFAGDPFGDGYADGTNVARECSIDVCVHYTIDVGNPDAVDPTDGGDVNTVPDYVDFALDTLQSIHTKYVGAGYREPKSDEFSSNNGSTDETPDPRTDIYLADIGDMFYGYCASDDPNYDEGVNYPFYDASAFCVLDNDYDPAQFPSLTWTQNLQVTAAHEYFHAVQFAYDYFEDSWLMEATATWVEDELGPVYDAINDNRQFLPHSPLSHPWQPLDYAGGTHEYGDWIFFRHFTERFSATVGGMPTFVRDIWRRADGSAVGPDQYSMQAVRNTVVARGASFPAAFSRFGALNRRAKTTYNEGATYPNAPLAGKFGLSSTRRSTTWLSVRIDHLANATARITPGASLKASNWRLRVNFNLPNKTRGSAATVQVYKRNGSVAVFPITLNSSGDTTKTFPFSVGSVKYVEVTATNASTRYQCWQGTGWSCLGKPLDQNLAFDFRATAYRS